MRLFSSSTTAPVSLAGRGPRLRPHAPPAPMVLGPEALFLGLAGAAGAAYRVLGEGPGPLPVSVDRERVEQRDIEVGACPRRSVGRPRTEVLARCVAAARPEAVALRDPAREDPLVRDPLLQDVLDHHARFQNGLLPPWDAELPAWLPHLMASPDVVVRTVCATDREEWEVPVPPETPSLHFVAAEDGSLWLAQSCRWGRRRCRTCLLHAWTVSSGGASSDRVSVAGATATEASVAEAPVAGAPRPWNSTGTAATGGVWSTGSLPGGAWSAQDVVAAVRRLAVRGPERPNACGPASGVGSESSAATPDGIGAGFRPDRVAPIRWPDCACLLEDRADRCPDVSCGDAALGARPQLPAPASVPA